MCLQEAGADASYVEGPRSVEELKVIGKRQKVVHLKRLALAHCCVHYADNLPVVCTNACEMHVGVHEIVCSWHDWGDLLIIHHLQPSSPILP